MASCWARCQLNGTEFGDDARWCKFICRSPFDRPVGSKMKPNWIKNESKPNPSEFGLNQSESKNAGHQQYHWQNVPTRSEINEQWPEGSGTLELSLDEQPNWTRVRHKADGQFVVSRRRAQRKAIYKQGNSQVTRREPSAYLIAGGWPPRMHLNRANLLHNGRHTHRGHAHTILQGGHFDTGANTRIGLIATSNLISGANRCWVLNARLRQWLVVSNNPQS